MIRKILIASRFLLVLPVIGSLLLMVGVVVMGLGVVLKQGWELLSQGDFSSKGAKQLMSVSEILRSVRRVTISKARFIAFLGAF